MSAAQIAVIACVVVWLALFAYLIYGFQTAPMGREDPKRGFIRTDAEGKDLE